MFFNSFYSRVSHKHTVFIKCSHKPQLFSPIISHEITKWILMNLSHDMCLFCPSHVLVGNDFVVVPYTTKPSE